jgi:hypothetical protein
MSKGEFCTRIASPTCERALQCGLDTSKSSCVSDFKYGCCEQSGSCGDKLKSAEEEQLMETFISDCSAGMSSFDCAALAQGEVPDSCMSLDIKSSSPLKDLKAKVSGYSLGQALQNWK